METRSQAKPDPLKSPRVFVKLRVPPAVHRRLKVRAARLGMAMEALAVAILDDRLPRDNEEAAPHDR